MPEKEKTGPGHDAAACHAALTSRTGVLAADAGYHSEANLAAPGPDRLFAGARTRDLARREPAAGPPSGDATPVEASTHRLATPEGRALYKRRAPDAGGLHASLNDDGGLRRFPPRGLHNATSEFLFADLAHNLRLLTAISRTPPGPQPPAQPPGQQQNRYAIAPANHEPGPEPGHKADSAARARRTQENATAP